MTYVIEPHVETYIDKAINKALIKFERATHRAIAKNEVQSQKRIDLVVERFEKKTASAVSDFQKKTDLAVDEFQKRTDCAVDTAHQKFKKEVEHHTGLLLEKFQSDLKLMGETVDFKIRETTREVIREEVTPRFEILETKLDMVIGEIRSINGGMKTFREEMHALRLDTNRHDKRIGRLEHAIA